LKNGALSHENEEDVIGKNGEIEEEDTGHDDSGDEKILVDTEHEKPEGCEDIFCDEKVDVSETDQDIHERIDFAGSLFHMKDGEVGVENGE
jgi:hypothetical protein